VPGGIKYRHGLQRQVFLGIRLFEDSAYFVGCGTLRRNASDSSDHGAEFSRRNVLAEICSPRLGDAFFHQSAAENVGSRLQTGQRILKPELHPRNLDIADVAVQQNARKRMNDQILTDRMARASASSLEKPRLGVNESQGNKLGKSAGVLLNVSEQKQMLDPMF